MPNDERVEGGRGPLCLKERGFPGRGKVNSLHVRGSQPPVIKRGTMK